LAPRSTDPVAGRAIRGAPAAGDARDMPIIDVGNLRKRRGEKVAEARRRGLLG